MAITHTKPDAVVHLGDYYEDGEAMAETFPHIRFHLVPGNCDRNRMVFLPSETLCYDVCGVKLFMTHGHRQWVKNGLDRLIAEAQAHGAQAALYGHTHQMDCRRLAGGMWLLNPGTCGSFGGSVGMIETNLNTIVSCRILRQEDLEGII